MNPYAKWIEGKDTLTVLSETPARIRELAKRLGAAGLNEPYAPGKWTVRQILLHLAQCEMVFSARFRHALTLDDYVIQPFDQDEWMQREATPDDDSALEAFCAMRQLNLSFWRTLSPEELQRALTHPERGRMNVQVMLETVAGHDLNHLEQLEAVAAGR
jgi:uncharacterized damage-inducible protein DinB